MDLIYCYCSRFDNSAQLKHISERDLIIISAFDTDILHHHNLDRCGHDSKLFNFCCECWNCVKKKASYPNLAFQTKSHSYVANTIFCN